jgi:hypothetical protein
MVIGTGLGWSNLATVVLAFGFGYSFTITPVMRSGLSFRAAAPVALAADTVSVTVMEILDTLVVLAVPGAGVRGRTRPSVGARFRAGRAPPVPPARKRAW